MEGLSKFIYGDMEEALETIRKIDAKKDADLERLREENKRLREEHYKDEELQKLQDKIKDLSNRALLFMSEKEKEAEKAFRKEHYEKCKNGNHYIYDLRGSGIGTGIYITCPKCGERKDITDVESW